MQAWISHLGNSSRSDVCTPIRRSGRFIIVAAVSMLLTASAARAQAVSYTFTSGPPGDGFNWPPSPTGLLTGLSFTTPDGVEFYNYTGNNVFFDTQYQVIGNAPGISDEAMWGNPLFGSFDTLDILFFGSGPPQTVGFDFAWSVAGAPDATPQLVDVYLEDSDGRATVVTTFLSNTFTGFGGVDGYADRIEFDASMLADDFNNVDGGPFIDIAYMYIFVDAIMTGGPASEFGVDNFDLDGGTGGGELFPSVNGGTINVSGQILARSVLRGSGTHGMGMEVTNGTASNTTYSTQLLPGGELDDAGQVNNASILAGQTLITPNLVSIQRSLTSESYDSDILLINDGDPLDPDDTVTLRINLFEPPSLSAPSPVDVTGGQNVQLANAAAPANGFRASVKVTGKSVSGPFSVAGFANGTPIKPGGMIEGDAAFDRFGLLSGSYNGSMTASLQMTAFVGVGNDIEVLLFEAEPVSDAVWTLDATLADTPADSAAYAAAQALGPGLVGVNSDTTAATLVGGTAGATGGVSMSLSTAQEGASTGVVGNGTEVSFTTNVPVFALQVTYSQASLCSAITEGNLRLLYFNTGASDWQLAVNGNSGGSATFFSGSFDDFAATLGGSPLSSALGTHGLDAANNHVWAIVNHEATFGVGEIGQTCHVPGDCDGDGDVDQDDFAIFELCATGPTVPLIPGCEDKDFDGDNDIDQDDFAVVQICHSGDGIPGDPDCAN